MITKDYDFKPWTKRAGAARPLSANMISVTKYGVLVINSSFDDAFFKSMRGAELYYDENHHIIGLKPSTEQYDCYKLRYQNKRSKVRSINIRRMMKTLNVKPQVYLAKWSEKHGMLVFQYELMENTKK